MRWVDAGLLASLVAGRRGRATNSPPQLGHLPPSRSPAQGAQNVHSKEQIRASVDSGGRSLSQHSQLGLSCSMGYSGFRLGFATIKVDPNPTGRPSLWIFLIESGRFF